MAGIEIHVAGSKRPALIDNEDYCLVIPYSWSLSGNGSIQAHILGTGRREYLHRIILRLKPGDPLVDHIDRDRFNNRKENLRLADKMLNAYNSKIRSDNRSGIRGVSRYKRRWRAYGCIAGKQVHLGVFDTRVGAGIAAQTFRKTVSPSAF